MVNATLHGVFLGTAIALVALGAAKIALAEAPSQPQTGTKLLKRLLTVHENAPRRVGAAEVLIGALALVFEDSVWTAAVVAGLGLIFVGVLAIRLRVIPGSGCGCIKAANKEPFLALSSVCRSAAMCAGGACGLIAREHVRVAGESVAGAAVWLLVVAALSPETWQYLNLRCGRPLVFAGRDDRRRLERSPGFQRLRDGGVIAGRASDAWAEGCTRYFAFAMLEDQENRQAAIFQVGPSGVLGRIVPRLPCNTQPNPQGQTRALQAN